MEEDADYSLSAPVDDGRYTPKRTGITGKAGRVSIAPGSASKGALTPGTRTPGKSEVAALGQEEEEGYGSVVLRRAVHATSKQRTELGSSVVLTPVRRSARKLEVWSVDTAAGLREELQGTGFSYTPNKNIDSAYTPSTQEEEYLKSLQDNLRDATPPGDSPDTSLDRSGTASGGRAGDSSVNGGALSALTLASPATHASPPSSSAPADAAEPLPAAEPLRRSTRTPSKAPARGTTPRSSRKAPAPPKEEEDPIAQRRRALRDKLAACTSP